MTFFHDTGELGHVCRPHRLLWTYLSLQINRLCDAARIFQQRSQVRVTCYAVHFDCLIYVVGPQFTGWNIPCSVGGLSWLGFLGQR